MARSVVWTVFAATLVLCTAQKALFDYVNKPDPTYSWVDTGHRIVNGTLGFTGYLLNMTSQAWLVSNALLSSVLTFASSQMPNETNHPIWYHQVMVLVPDKIKDPTTAAIWVTGGSNHDGPPGPISVDILVPAILGMETGTITVALFQIPNQPITFTADPQHSSRDEDSLVAFSWKMYADNQNRPEWVCLLPMVKAVVRAMDTVQAYANAQHGTKISKFLITGASKRGWTTWLSGAVDKRIIGIMPIVMDMLDFEHNVGHMMQAYGNWTFAFQPYWKENITTLIGTQKMHALGQIVDPLVYKSYLTMPKLVIDSTGDEFFMPDDDWYWWGQLQGETLRMMVQNAEHSMITGVPEIMIGARAWYQALIDGSPRPQFSWTLDYNTGLLNVTSVTKPNHAWLRHAKTVAPWKRRDFRLVTGDTPANPCIWIKVPVFGGGCLIPIIWEGKEIQPTSITPSGSQVYTVQMPVPDKGWQGYFVELGFPGPGNSQYLLSTQVAILPNTMPFPACTGQACLGGLV